MQFAADTSIGEETYDGQKITDDPTWIGELALDSGRTNIQSSKLSGVPH